MDENSKIITYCNKNEIENRLTEHDKEHFRKAKNSNASNDKTVNHMN